MDMSTKFELAKVRNIGISAHIDSGKTTLTERILFYSGKIHKMGEVRGEGATMDSMELEKEKGITISSAATTVSWGDYWVNIIDTPGHVDFTVEVERSLRVLDGAILVLCGVGGVQSQSITVDRQMKRYQTPRLAFINKLDRAGANPKSVVNQLKEKLGVNAVPVQIPIGISADLEGIVDLITMKAAYFDGEKGETVRFEEIPANLKAEADKARHEMLDALSMFSDEIMEKVLEDQPVDEQLIHETIRKATLTQEVTPVLMGSAYKNKGVQLLLDAVGRYLPTPLDREISATDISKPKEPVKVKLAADPKKPMVGMAFKLVEEPTGQITYFRIYQGTVNKGEMYVNSRTGRTQRFSRILRVHADEREDIPLATAGDIVAIVGIDCASGDTYCGGDLAYALESIFVPDAVISLAVSPEKRGDGDKMTKALQRFRKEDPTFRLSADEETNETIIAGMGELHLEIYLERIRREYGVNVIASPPKVSYREAPTREAAFDYKHKKQTGGSGQYGHIVGKFQLIEDESQGNFVFENKVTGGRIPNEYIPSVQKGFEKVLGKGPVAGYPVVGLKVRLEDGSYHDVDSSDMAFQVCAMDCFRQQFQNTKPVILEPVMKVEIEVPTQFQGPVGGDISSRRGMIMGSESREGFSILTAEVPLANMFGYSTDLRSATQGKGTFSMEFSRYARVPSSIQEEIIKKSKEAALAKR
jgi:elongation factor G